MRNPIESRKFFRKRLSQNICLKYYYLFIYYLLIIFLIFQDEWERELERLTNRFQQEMQVKKRRPESEIGALTLRHQQERADLEKNMTLRRDKKKESLTRKMLEHERYLWKLRITLYTNITLLFFYL